MTRAWTRKVQGDTPLPKAFETSLRVAVASYQGTLSLSLSQLTRDGGRNARVRPLWLQLQDHQPETYQEALTMLQAFIADVLERLENEGIG